MRLDRFRKAMVEALEAHLKSSKPPRLPAGGELAWRWFVALCRTRSMGFASPNPLTHAEIEAYARLNRLPLEPRHVDTILALDRAFLDHAGPASPPSAPPRGPSEKVNPAAFDAVFG
jgi:hypothetical protein